MLVGLNDQAEEGVYENVDQTPYWDGGWSRKDPNQRPGDGDCVRLKKYKKDNTYRLADGNCKKKYPFLCKKMEGDNAETIPCRSYLPNIGMTKLQV